MDHHNNHNDGICECKASGAVQSLDDMDFERGIWAAALYNDIDRLQKLIEQGKTNSRDNFGYTALHYAARKNNLTVCQHLLDAGADVNEKTNSSGSTALHRAAMMGNDKVVELLMHHKAVTEMKDADGNTALHRAAQNGHLGVTKILVKHNKMNKLSMNNNGQTPFDLIPDINDLSLGDDLKTFLSVVE